MRFSRFVCGLVAAIVAGCGGGGSSSSSAGSSITVSVSPPALTVSTTTTDAAPTANLELTANNIPSGGLYVGVDHTSRAVLSTSLSQAGAAEEVVVAFQSPAALGAGVFNDTLTIRVCLDAQCTQQISNSPMQVTVTLNVATGNPATATPTLTSISPTTTQAGGPAFTLVASGAQFAPTTVLQWNGSARPTTYVSPTSLSAQISAADVAAVQTASVTVSNAGTGGGVSMPINFAVTLPGPVVSAVSPTTVGVGGSAFLLTVTGSGFVQNEQIQWNGSYRQTSFVSSTTLTAIIPATDLVATGSFAVTVFDPFTPAVSNPISVNVIDAPLSLTKLSPTTVTAGGLDFVETVIGTGFTASSSVQWNGSARPTTFVSTTELLAQFRASDIAGLGAGTVNVVDTGAHAGTSASQTVTIAAKSIDAVAFQINAQHNGAVAFANIVAPSAFPLASTWTASLDGPPSYALIAGGRVFATVSLSGGVGELVALDASTGAKLWGPIALPYASNAAYDNGKVFVLSANIGTSGMVSAYDAATGTKLWTTALTSQYWFTGPPVAANGFVYVGGAGSGGTLYAVDQTTGALTWTYLVNGGSNASPSVTADGVYVSYPCQTYDFRPLTGELVWQDNAGCEGGGGATGTVANGVVYSPNLSTSFGGSSFNAETGVLLGSYGANAPPAIGSQTGYFLQGTTLRAITLSNDTIQWSFDGDGTFTTAPILVNGYVFILGDSGKLYTLDGTTGAALSQSNLGGAMTSSNNGYGQMQASGLSAGDGLLVVPAGNKLIAFTLSTNP